MLIEMFSAVMMMPENRLLTTRSERMKRLFLLGMLLGVALVAAACGGGPSAPAATSVPAEATAEAAPTLFIVTRAAPIEIPEGGLEIPGVGTLVASETEDPYFGQPFTKIALVTTKGTAESRVEIILNGDGTYTRNGTAGVLSATRVEAIRTALDELNFFGLQGTMLGPGGGGNEAAAQYGLSIERGGFARSIVSMDGYMPQQYLEFVGLIFEVGLRP
jgi:hypothetical protein